MQKTVLCLSIVFSQKKHKTVYDTTIRTKYPDGLLSIHSRIIVPYSEDNEKREYQVTYKHRFSPSFQKDRPQPLHQHYG